MWRIIIPDGKAWIQALPASFAMKYFLLHIILLACLSMFGQHLTVNIRDASSNEPVEGASLSLFVHGDSLYCVSDNRGKAVFNFSGKGILEISHLAYKPVVQSVRSAAKEITVHLIPSQNELDEVVVTGQAGPILSSKSVRQIKVIDAQRIQQQAAVSLRDLLTNDLSFQMTEDPILGSRINMQGLGGAKVKILVDGVPVIGRLDGNIDLSQINLNDVQRVEIVEGPMSVQYGTDAVAGTINLITKQSIGNTTKGKINGYYETVGRYNFDGDINFPIGKISGGLSLGRNYFNGYDPSSAVRDLQWNPKDQYFISPFLQRRFNKLLLRYRGDFFDEIITNLGEVGSIDSAIVQVDTGAWKYPRALDDRYRTYRFNNALYLDYFIGKLMKLKAFVAYNYYERIKTTTIKNLTTGEQNYFSGTDAQDTTVFGLLSSRLFFNHNWFPNKFSYQLGYDFNYEGDRGERIEGDYKSITDAALFGTFDYKPIEKLTIQPGFRYAYNSRFQAPFINSLALRYQPAKNWILRASYGQGFRAPTLKELYFLFVDENHNILGNANLKAESSDNFQVGLNYTKSFNKLVLEANVQGFFNNIKNEISLIPVIEPDDEDPRGLYRNENIAHTQTSGGTFTLKIAYQKLEVSTGASLIGIKNDLAFSETAMDEGNDQFNFYPQWRFDLNYDFKKIGLVPSLFINHTGRRRVLTSDGEGNLNYIKFESYTRADLSIRKQFWKEHIDFSVGIKNIFNITTIQANNLINTGAHSTGTNSIPLSYGRSFFTRVQISLP